MNYTSTLMLLVNISCLRITNIILSQTVVGNFNLYCLKTIELAMKISTLHDRLWSVDCLSQRSCSSSSCVIPVKAPNAGGAGRIDDYRSISRLADVNERDATRESDKSATHQRLQYIHLSATITTVSMRPDPHAAYMTTSITVTHTNNCTG